MHESIAMGIVKSVCVGAVPGLSLSLPVWDGPHWSRLRLIKHAHELSGHCNVKWTPFSPRPRDANIASISA